MVVVVLFHFELVNDRDLLLLIERMLHLGGLDTVQISKVKGHADEGMVLDGRVSEVDRLVNDAACEAADIGRRRVGVAVTDARRTLSGVCGRWYPVVLDLHRSFIVISPDPLVWSARLVHAVRDGAFLPGPPVIWDSEWVNVPAPAICAEDIAHWPRYLGQVGCFLGHTPLACWWFGSWEVVGFMLNCSFFMSFGLVRGCLLKKLNLDILGQGDQFQCRSVWSRH